METGTYSPNPLIMDAKELLHLRIEQANDKLLEALVAMTEGLFKVYQPEVLEGEMNQAEFDQLPEPEFKRMTMAEQKEAIDEGLAEYHRGEGLPFDELEKELEHAR